MTHENLKPDEIAMLERAEKATKGPWEASVTGVCMGMGYNDYADQVRIGIHDHTVAHQSVKTGDVEQRSGGHRLVNYTNAGKPEAGPDARFIAAARTDLPTILMRLANERAKLAIAMRALGTIKAKYGKVCNGFELCDHAACESSSGAWQTTDAALARINELEKQHGETRS